MRESCMGLWKCVDLCADRVEVLMGRYAGAQSGFRPSILIVVTSVCFIMAALATRSCLISSIQPLTLLKLVVTSSLIWKLPNQLSIYCLRVSFGTLSASIIPFINNLVPVLSSSCFMFTISWFFEGAREIICCELTAGNEAPPKGFGSIIALG